METNQWRRLPKQKSLRLFIVPQRGVRHTVIPNDCSSSLTHCNSSSPSSSAIYSINAAMRPPKTVTYEAATATAPPVKVVGLDEVVAVLVPVVFAVPVVVVVALVPFAVPVVVLVALEAVVFATPVTVLVALVVFATTVVVLAALELVLVVVVVPLLMRVKLAQVMRVVLAKWITIERLPKKDPRPFRVDAYGSVKLCHMSVKIYCN